MHAAPFKIALLVMAILVAARPFSAVGAEGAKENGAHYLVHAGGIKRTYVCAEGVEEGAIEDGVVHANLVRGKERFLLITYTEPSNPANPNGNCGGGVECYLVWLRISGNTVLAAQSERYASCLQNITAGKLTWAKQLCTVEYEGTKFNQDTKERVPFRAKAAFDTKAPEKGIQIGSLPVKKAGKEEKGN